MRLNTASDLRRRAEMWHKAKATTKDAFGQYPVAPAKIKDLWVAVTPLTGSLISGRQADTVVSHSTHRVECRREHRGIVSPENWLIIDGLRYDIQYFQCPDNNPDRIEIFCEVRFDGTNGD